ncbi:hypothetical protein L249_7459 [Ophiocordyceps polyrhachis-furcata BCC 54312]|uniref:Uncharacterized protein n=1 Tax=Ophiocordyceps polyrhachis-furcata BCC 54312 TaxID=1330021 RepID=A0A367LBR9_9HYPO|nr:hypothetical protein L249_7459 [Ophiocordyceps polyrhachis-furcata BCC 54312]
MIMSNQGVDHVIEKKKTNHVMVVLSDKVEADNKLEVGTSKDFNVMDQPDDLTLVRLSRSGAMTAIGTARRSLTARRSMYSAPIAITSLIGTICSKWPYRLISYPFKMKKYALYSS